MYTDGIQNKLRLLQCQ